VHVHISVCPVHMQKFVCQRHSRLAALFTCCMLPAGIKCDFMRFVPGKHPFNTAPLAAYFLCPSWPFPSPQSTPLVKEKTAAAVEAMLEPFPRTSFANLHLTNVLHAAKFLPLLRRLPRRLLFVSTRTPCTPFNPLIP